MTEQVIGARARAGHGKGLGLALRVALCLLVVTTAACQRRSTAALRVGLEQPPLGLDPHLHNDLHTWSVLANVYESLVSTDAELRVGPGLAVAWKNPADRVWQFQLRREVRFHDGRPLTADDVVYSLERARTHPRSDVGSYVLAIESVRAIDPFTVEVTTAAPAATLLRKLAFVSIVPHEPLTQIDRPIGTGPYRYVTTAPDGAVVLEAYPDYWGEAPGEPRLELRAIPDGNQRVAKLLAGEVDLIESLSPRDIARVEAAASCKVVAHESLLVRYLGMRVDRPPFDDRRVRQAIDLALDRPALVERMLLGQGRPASQMATANVVGYAPDVVPTRRDLPRARQLLAEAGHADGLQVTLEVAEGLDTAEIRRQLAEAGIQVEPAERAWDDIYPRMIAGDVLFVLGGVVAESGDTSDVLDPMFHSRNADKGYGDANSSGYSHPEVDDLIEKSGVTLDPLLRRQLLQRAMQLLMQDLPAVAMVEPYDLYAMRREVEWTPRLDSALLLASARRGRQD